MSTAKSNFSRLLTSSNYRVWVAGAFVSYIGTWVQRTAQSWLVLTVLTDHNASAVGIVLALQFGPQLILLPWTGYAADHLDQRRLLIATQAIMGALALILGVLTTSGAVQLWHVYIFAALFGSAAAFDTPVRQVFVGELVGDSNLANAIALNFTLFNVARMIGPAISGVIITSTGTGWAFIINGASFVAVLISLSLLQVGDLHRRDRAYEKRSGLTVGFRYVWSRSDLKAVLIMLLVIATFGLNFQIFIPTMAVGVFRVDAWVYGLLSASMAVGTMAGALLSARRSSPQFETLLGGSGMFGFGCTLAAIAPGVWTFALALMIAGLGLLILITTSNSFMQLSTDRAMRGRVMACVSVASGGIPIGAPIVGWIADHLGPRWALSVGAASGFAAAIGGTVVMMRERRKLQAQSDEDCDDVSRVTVRDIDQTRKP